MPRKSARCNRAWKMATFWGMDGITGQGRKYTVLGSSSRGCPCPENPSPKNSSLKDLRLVRRFVPRARSGSLRVQLCISHLESMSPLVTAARTAISSLRTLLWDRSNRQAAKRKPLSQAIDVAMKTLGQNCFQSPVRESVGLALFAIHADLPNLSSSFRCFSGRRTPVIWKPMKPGLA